MHTRLLALGLTLYVVPALADGGHAGHDMAGNGHMKMTAHRDATPADEARFAALEEQVRSGLTRYRDVSVATAEGFEPFLRGVPQEVVHYTKRSNGFAALFGFDPLKPTSLLYRKEPDGRMELVGVMYTAPARFDEKELDARVPLSVAPWHQHVSLCVPGFAHRERWTETKDGRPVFGPGSAIDDENECDAVGGKFVPRLFGWMVHVNAFEDG